MIDEKKKEEKKKEENKIVDLYGNNLSNGSYFNVWKDDDIVNISLDFMSFSIPAYLFSEFTHLLYACHIKASEKATVEGLKEAEEILKDHDEFIEEMKKDEEESEDAENEDNKKVSEEKNIIN